MPDSQVPPLWGPAYDERDLDALLSGRTGSTPAALRPVESTLAALRTDATGRELAREAAARAAFRAFAPAAVTAHAGGGACGRHLQPRSSDGRPPPAPAAQAPAPPPGRPGRAQARPRGDRRRRDRPDRGRGRRHRRPDRLDRRAHVVRAAARQRQPRPPVRPRTHQATQGPLATGAARVPTPSPKPTTASAPATPRPTSGPGSLCREFFEYPEHPVPGGAAAWFALGGQLSKLAGGPFKVYGYCLRYLDNPLAGRGGWPMVRPAPRGRADGETRTAGASARPASARRTSVPRPSPPRAGTIRAPGQSIRPATRLIRAAVRPIWPGQRPGGWRRPALSPAAAAFGPVRLPRPAHRGWPCRPARRPPAGRRSAGRRPVAAPPRRAAAPPRGWRRRRPG